MNGIDNPSVGIPKARFWIVGILLLCTTYLSFGGLPINPSWSANVFNLYFNFIAVAAWGLGIWATIYFFKNRSRIKSAGNIYWVSSIISILLFAINVCFAVVMTVLMHTGHIKAEQPGMTATGFLPMAKIGKEIWSVGGVDYQIRGTYYLVLDKKLQYTIEFEHSGATSIRNEDAALELVFPLMEHAYSTKKYKRVKFNGPNGDEFASRIGVAIFVQDKMKTQGYRAALSVDEIASRINSEGKAPIAQ